MGRLANGLDWTTDGSGAFRLLDRAIRTSPPSLVASAERVDSGIRIATARSWEPEEPAEDDPTRPYDRASVSMPAAGPPRPIAELDRATGCSVARLGALLEWLAREEPASVVVDFVTDFLAGVGALNHALGRFTSASARSASPALRTTSEALLRAIGLWRASVVDHVDELALTQNGALDGWSSLPEYSATYALAFVRPALEAAREWTVVAREDGEAVAGALDQVEEAVADIDWILRRASVPGDGRRTSGETTQPESPGRAVAW